MESTANFGSERKFELHQAILLYRENGQSTCAATVHDVANRRNQLVIEPGQPITLAGLEALAMSLGKQLENCMLPERVLSLSMSQMAWWCPASRRRIWFKPGTGVKDAAMLRKLNGKFVQHPALLFIAGRGLTVLALAADGRPTPTTRVYRAPYFNLSPQGVMCEGTAKLPQILSVNLIDQFEHAFFNSAFSHSNWGHMITRHPRGHAGLWSEMAQRKSPFPERYLKPSTITAGRAIANAGKSKTAITDL